MIDRYPIIFAISLQIVCPLGLIIEPTVLSTKRTKNIRSDMPHNKMIIAVSANRLIPLFHVPLRI